MDKDKSFHKHETITVNFDVSLPTLSVYLEVGVPFIPECHVEIFEKIMLKILYFFLDRYIIDPFR